MHLQFWVISAHWIQQPILKLQILTGFGIRSLTLFQLKPLQNKKGQIFIRKKTAFFSGTPNFFGPSYFEAALGKDTFYHRDIISRDKT